MVTTAGLVLDIIGAVLLLFGLFRYPIPLYVGWLRSPEAAAEDRAYGITGGVFFVLGFVGQLFGNAGIGGPVTRLWWAIALGVLVVGGIAAYGLFKWSRHWQTKVVRRWLEERPDILS